MMSTEFDFAEHIKEIQKSIQERIDTSFPIIFNIDGKRIEARIKKENSMNNTLVIEIEAFEKNNPNKPVARISGMLVQNSEGLKFQVGGTYNLTYKTENPIRGSGKRLLVEVVKSGICDSWHSAAMATLTDDGGEVMYEDLESRQDELGISVVMQDNGKGREWYVITDNKRDKHR